MSTHCRFPACTWSGLVDDLFRHCELYHAQGIRELGNRNYFDFTLDELSGRLAFLLLGQQGLYWFCRYDGMSQDAEDKEALSEDLVRLGVFHIGDSLPIEYTLKIGRVRDRHAEYLGEYESQLDPACAMAHIPANLYELELEVGFLKLLYSVNVSRRVRLYIGTFDDSDDQYIPTANELSRTAEVERINRLCVERFTCCVCMEFIRRDVRFCERKHFVCRACFETMQQRGQLRCPLCRTEYPYDCCDPRFDDLLRMIRFPVVGRDGQGKFS